MSDKELIQICIEEISHKLGYPDPHSLRQRDLEHLCREIEKRTNILISLSTIKRLLNGQFNRLPQIATLNAITNYLGYESWQDFKVKKLGQVPTMLLGQAPTMPLGQVSVNPEQEMADVKELPQKKSRKVSYIVIAMGIVVLSLSLVSLGFFTKKDNIKEAAISFSVKKVTSNDIPNTVVFNYDLKKVKGDSFFIQQSWDQDRRVKIDKNGNTLTDIYYEPGYHNAKLMVNDQVVKTIDAHIPTNGWYFYSKPALFQGLPTSIRPAKPVHDSILSITPEDIVASKIDTKPGTYYFYTLFPSTMSVPTDNFSFKARMRWVELKNVNCPKIMYEIFGQSSSLFFFTTPAGCTGEIMARFGEHFLEGKSNDLSAFGGDITQWQDIEVVVKNKEAKVYINKKEIYSKSYTESYGLITGMAFISNGIIEIDNIELKGLDRAVVYADDFSN